MENLITLTVRSTHFYLLDFSGVRLLIDAGWAGTLPALRAELKRSQLDLPDIHYVMPTHYHPDHAGLVQPIKNAGGALLVIHEAQIPFIKDLEDFHKRKGDTSYVPVQVTPRDVVLKGGDTRALQGLGIQGEVFLTPGHSDDSLSFVSAGGLAFTGDLTLPGMAEEDKADVVAESWRKLLAAGARTFYPAHGNPAPRERIEQMLAGW